MTVPSASGRRTRGRTRSRRCRCRCSSRRRRCRRSARRGRRRGRRAASASGRRRGRAAGRCAKRSPDVERVAPADLPAVDADLLGEQVEHALDREVRLVDAEAAHRAARRVVRVDGASPRRRRSARGRRRRRGRRRARAPCRRRWRRRRCRRRCARGRRRSRALLVAADACSRATSGAAWSGSAGSRARVSVTQHRAGRSRSRAARRGTWTFEVLLGAERAAGRDLRDAHVAPRAGRGTTRPGGGRPRRPGPASRRAAPLVLGHGERRLGLEEGVLDELRPEASR